MKGSSNRIPSWRGRGGGLMMLGGILFFWIATTCGASRPTMAMYRYGRRPSPRRIYRQRPTTPSSSSQEQQEERQPMRVDKSHFLDDEDWILDRRNRPWGAAVMTQKRRRPGDYSWSSRIVMINVVCYAIQVMQPRFTQWGLKLSEPILRGEQLHRLWTPMFLHGGLMHLFTNSYSLNNIGGYMERFFGPGRFLAAYLVSGIAGSYASAVGTPNPSLGASGAVFGVTAAFSVFLSQNGWLLGRQGQAFQDAILQTFLMNGLYGLMNPQIDNFAHVGGAVAGGLLAYYFGPRLYLAPLPDGATTIVDRPRLRLPPAVEALPSKFQRGIRRMQVWGHLPSEQRPWQRRRGAPRQQRQGRGGSIKPKIVD